ncbi:MAG: polysaccharide biosynthesis/export family protein, partial [Tannerella sp.]|nr:polysaccharide biosynthesis/export family protein [Tannerella sp.]
MKKILYILVCIFINSGLYSQTIGMQELKSLKVGDLTDAQIKEFIEVNTKAGYTMAQLEEQALQNGMPSEEWRKLKARIDALSMSEESKDYTTPASISRNAEREAERYTVTPEDDHVKIYGSSLFNTSNLTFQPNLRLPTPENYLLGPDDELIINVFGLSEDNHRATVSPEGAIYIPRIGLTYVGGLTIKQATKLITNKLAQIYSAINQEKTFV